MKNLLDHFRRKPAPPAAAPVKALEPAKPAAEPIKPVRLQTAVARAIKPAWHATAAPFPQRPRTPALADRALPTEIVTLRLGDFLDRLPPELLDTGTHDRGIPMPFDLTNLSERIGRGEAMIRVTEVYRRMPDVFRSDAAIHPDRMVPFPWKKVLEMMQGVKAGAGDGGISPAGVAALAQKFKARKLRQPGKMAPAPRTAAGGAGADSVPDGAMSVAPATSGLRTAAPPPVAQTSGTAGGATDAATAHDLAQLRAERDAALARAAEFGAEYDASIGRTGELSDERDAAVARAAELTAGHDAAVARAAETAAERDAAITRLVELTAVRDAAAARIEKLVADSQAAVTRAGDLASSHAAAVARAAGLTAERDAAAARVAALTAERDAALARAAEPSAERDAALARVTAVTAERDAAVARAEKLAADCEAALALGTELTAERDTLTARLTALAGEREATEARVTTITAERDAAVARAEKLAAENDAALAGSRESGAERDGVSARVAALSAERDAALRRITELTAERDAAVACSAELLQAAESARPAAAEPAVATDSSLAIEGCKNTIDALIRERDALRKSHGQPAEDSAVAKAPESGPAAAANEDAYAELFPARQWFQRAAAAAVLALLAVGVVSQMPLGAVWQTEAAPSGEILPPAEPDVFLPILSEVALPEQRLTLEAKPPKETMTLPGATAGLLD